MTSDTLSEKAVTCLLPLIQQLSNGETHSGEALGALLGISRTAVWKQLKKLDQLGLSVHSVKGAGYRISEPLELLDEDLIVTALTRDSSLAVRLEVKPCIDSTNSFVSSRLRTLEIEQGEVVVCAAEMQTAGRGRRGRSWVSPFASNLYFSVGIRAPDSLGSYQGLSLAVGVEVVQGLKDLFPGFTAQLKWPNDILLEGKKLAGILIEVDGDLSGNCNLVIGVGMNYRMPKTSSDQIDQPWADLTSALSRHEYQTVDRSQVLACLVKRLARLVSQYPSKGFGSFREQWLSMDGFFGLPVTVTTGGYKVMGVSSGVDDDGALLVNIDGEIQKFSGGEVSLRGGQ